MNQQPLVFKVIVVGQSGSGKTCLIQRYLHDQFTDNYSVTLGVEYHTKVIKVDNNIQIKLKIWDTAGQQCFNSIVKSFYRNTNVVLLVYDITRKQTFQNLDQWHMQALQSSPQQSIYVLVGTHLDIPQHRQVQQQQARKWMSQANIQIYFQTSAKTSQNIDKMFQQVCKQLLLTSLKQKRQTQTTSFHIQPGSQSQKSFCC